MKEKHAKAIKLATSMGVKLTILDQPSSGKVLFPEKMEIAKKVIANLKTPLPV